MTWWCGSATAAFALRGASRSSTHDVFYTASIGLKTWLQTLHSSRPALARIIQAPWMESHQTQNASMASQLDWSSAIELLLLRKEARHDMHVQRSRLCNIAVALLLESTLHPSHTCKLYRPPTAVSGLDFGSDPSGPRFVARRDVFDTHAKKRQKKNSPRKGSGKKAVGSE